MPGVSLCVVPGMRVNADVDVSAAVEAGTEKVLVEEDVTITDVIVGAGEESAPNTAPTIIKLATVLAARIVPTIRLSVIRMRISFSQCMDHSFSSGLGH
jgi:hypothetical protein